MSSKSVELQAMKNAILALNALSVYRNILQDRVMVQLLKLLNYITTETTFELNQFVEYYNNFYFALTCESHTGSNNSFRSYLINKIILDENPFTKAAEFEDFSKLNSSLAKTAAYDLSYIQTLSGLSSFSLKRYVFSVLTLDSFQSQVVNNLPAWEVNSSTAPRENAPECPDVSAISSVFAVFSQSDDWSKCIESLAKFHHQNGRGIFALCKAFLWKHKESSCCFEEIMNPDPITLSDLIGYDEERLQVIENTLSFLKGYPANNMLLYGDRGTGKSSTVKAILNKYSMQGLRMVEVPKNHLMDFPGIMKILGVRNQKFIVFVDDLAFEDNEENYTALKAVLEGGIEIKPSNVLIYATSNRRHLIKEKFSDRAGLQSGNLEDEIRAYDTIQEKLSLADRFGMTVVFSSPDKKKYLQIVEGIAEQRGLNVDRETLHKEALKWELWYNGRSPRTARQFVDWFEGHLKG